MRMLINICLLALLSTYSCKLKSSEKLKTTFELKTKEMSLTSILVSDTITIEDRAKLLKNYLKNLDESDKYHTKYFDLFPEDFTTFNDLFGYKKISLDSLHLGPLYYESGKFISVFFEKLNISREKIYSKAIEIAKTGKWDADAVNILQGFIVPYNPLEKKLTNQRDLEILIKLLESHSPKDIQGFWYFYFDGPHPVAEIPQELERLKSISNEVYHLMKEAHQQVLEDNKHHNHQ